MAKKRNTEYTDALGQKVPAKYVLAYDKARDAAAEAICEKWTDMEDKLVALHRWTLGQIAGVVEASKADPAARGIGAGSRGNAQFRSFDGRVVVSLDVQAREEFEPQLIAEAQRLVQEVIAEGQEMIRASGAGGLAVDVAEIAARAFTPRKSGKLDMARVRELTTLRVAHPKWERAMEIIGSAARIVGARRYLRVEVRETPESQPRAILLDMAAAGTIAETQDAADAVRAAKEGGAA
jgi:hypothetical protein